MFLKNKKFLKKVLQRYNLTLLNDFNGLRCYNCVTICYNVLQFPNKGWVIWYFLYIPIYPFFCTIEKIYEKTNYVPNKEKEILSI